MSYDDFAMPCCMVATPDRVNLGNMAARGVLPVWDGEPYRRVRAQLDSDAPREVCRTCALCAGTVWHAGSGLAFNTWRPGGW